MERRGGDVKRRMGGRESQDTWRVETWRVETWRKGRETGDLAR